jgi:hypothetical protein
MKFKYLPLAVVSAIVLPSIALISCSNTPLTSEQITQQKFLVNEAAEKKIAPVITLTKDTNINEIKENLVNFDKLNNEELLYEIVNFEIPLIASVDNKVNVKVSSKLDSTIYRTYSFMISENVVNNSFKIGAMSEQAFKDEVNIVYFKDQFLSDLINDISIRVNQTSHSLDITEKVLVKNSEGIMVLTPALMVPELKTAFINRFKNFVTTVVVNKFNSVALQDIEIIINDITQDVDSLPNIVGIVKMDIIFGEGSIYTLDPFNIDTFSREYLDLENDLKFLLIENIKPTLLIGNGTPINIQDLFKNLRISMNDDFSSEFGIGVIAPSPEIILEGYSNDTEINIEIFSKKYNQSIVGTYKVKIGDIINAQGNIDFTPRPITPVNQVMKRGKL